MQGLLGNLYSGVSGFRGQVKQGANPARSVRDREIGGAVLHVAEAARAEAGDRGVDRESASGDQYPDDEFMKQPNAITNPFTRPFVHPRWYGEKT
jgi:hypothetical protein